ncbi:unnamed protein product, partial [Prorocentrum cordatum]
AERGLLARRRVQGWAVEAVLGHLTFCGLCSRGALSVFKSVRGFAQAHYDYLAVLWAEARRELAAISSLTYVLGSDWRPPWKPMAQQSDAGLHGHGLARAFWPREWVESALDRKRGKLEFRGLPEDEEQLSQWAVVGDFPEPSAPPKLGREFHPSRPLAADGADAAGSDPARAAAGRVDAFAGGRAVAALAAELGQVVEGPGKGPMPTGPARAAPASAVSSDSASSGPEGVTGAARQRRTSLLEREAARAPTQREYLRAWDGWRDFARRSWPSVGVAPLVSGRDDSAVDAAPVNYLDGLHQAGARLSWAEKLMAGVLHLNPDFTRHGARRLPRGWRCLRAWRRMELPRTRKPWALGPWRAMAWRMKARGSLQTAVFTLIAVSARARPSSLLRLKPSCLAPPATGARESWTLRLFLGEELRGKTGLGGASLELDSRWIRFVDPVLRQLRLWDFTYPEYCRMFSLRLQDLEVRAKMVPYQMRHSGAPIDMARKWRRLGVEDHPQRRTLSEARQGGGHVGDFHQHPAGHVLGLQGPARGHHFGSRLAGRLVRARPRLVGLYLADSFSGMGGVGRAAMASGVPVRFRGPQRGSAGDLTQRSVWRGLSSDIAKGRVLAATLALPRGPWTAAADRVGAIRSASMPWGLPRHLLSEQQLARLAS